MIKACAALLGGLLVLSGLSSCGIFPEDDPCTRATLKSGQKPGELPALLLLLDVNDNSEGAVKRTTETLRPVIADALRQGAYIRAVASGGEKQPLQASTCLDGRPFLVKWRNATRQGEELEAGTNDIVDDLARFLGTVPVAKNGSATRLLQSTTTQLGRIQPAEGIRVGPPTVVLASNLLGRSDPSDCLNVQGQIASPERTAAIIDRCFRSGQLSPLPGSKVRLVEIGEGAETMPQTFMANLLAASLCAKISDDCAGA